MLGLCLARIKSAFEMNNILAPENVIAGEELKNQQHPVRSSVAGSWLCYLGSAGAVTKARPSSRVSDSRGKCQMFPGNFCHLRSSPQNIGMGGHNWGTSRGDSLVAIRRQNKGLWCSA